MFENISDDDAAPATSSMIDEEEEARRIDVALKSLQTIVGNAETEPATSAAHVISEHLSSVCAEVCSHGVDEKLLDSAAMSVAAEDLMAAGDAGGSGGA
eukprot:11992534-Karenia_brevis.AAC.1